MSTIRYFDDTPHVVRYGMTDDDPAKCEMQFWRNGVHFLIKVDHSDVRGTDFEQKWLPFLKTSEAISPHVGRWNGLCDLVISQSLGTLQELAPNRSHWNTIYDFLHADSYTLRLSGTPEQDVSAQIVEGPTSTCAYDMEVAAWETFTIPDGLPVYDSQVITCLDQDRDLKGEPEKFRLPDGKVAFFYPCKVWFQRAIGSVVEDVPNESHKAIASYLHVNSLQIPNESVRASIPKVLGVVSDSGRSATDTQAEGEKRVAGILLEWIDGFRLLNAGLKGNLHVTMSSETNQARWRDQVVGTMSELRRRGVSGLDLEISPFSIMIDRNDGHAWLAEFVDGTFLEDDNAADTNEAESEAKKIQAVFDQWLRVELEHWKSEQQESKEFDGLDRWRAIADPQD